MAADTFSFHITVLWLKPGVKLISRDRAGMYAEGAKRGAPRARQIADRSHLLVNLRDALKDALARQLDSLPVVEEHGKQAVGEVGVGAVAAEAPRLPAAQLRRQVSRANRYARYQQILALSRAGLRKPAIARQLHLILNRMLR